MSVSTGHTAIEAGTGEPFPFRAHKNYWNTAGEELAWVVSHFTCSIVFIYLFRTHFDVEQEIRIPGWMVGLLTCPSLFRTP